MTATNDMWDEWAAEDTYVRFDTPGDTVCGLVVSISKHTWPDGTSAPQIVLNCPDEVQRIVTAGQVQLKRHLADLRPGIGDLLTITLTGVEPRPGGKTMKVFQVDVDRDTTATDADQAAPVTVPPVTGAERDAVAAARALLAEQGLQ